MHTDHKFFWMRLDFRRFESGGDLDFLMSQKDGANYVVLYQMLVLNTRNTAGMLVKQLGEMIIPFDVDTITRDCKYFSRDTVLVALELYKKLGLIYEANDGMFQLSDFGSLIGSESQAASRMRKMRERQKEETLLLQESDNECSDEGVTMLHNPLRQRQDTRDKIQETKDTDIERTNVLLSKKAEKAQEILDEFNLVCPSLPRAKTLSDSRKRAINARLKEHGEDAIRKVFDLAEHSSWLKGDNNSAWKATFDWLMNPSNFVKVLEGNYSDERHGRSKEPAYQKSEWELRVEAEAEKHGF